MRRPAIPLVSLCALFLAVTIYRASARPFWYDELFTVYLTALDSPEAFARAIRAGVDLNPPLLYAATWLARKLAGTGEAATRLPAIAGFLVMLVALYRFTARRMPAPFALLAASTLLVTGAYPYAMEARAYGLLLGFTGLALAFWQRAAEADRKRRHVLGMSMSVLGALLTHCYALIPVAALAAGELVRTRARRRIDLGIWLGGLMAPGTATLLYIPLLSSSKRVQLAGPIFDPSVIRLMAAYGDLLSPALPAIVAAAIVVAIAAWPGRSAASIAVSRAGFRRHEWAALAVLGLAPAMAFLLSSATGGGFFARYGLGAAVALSAAWAAVCHRWWRASPELAGLLPLLGLLWFALGFAGDVAARHHARERAALPRWDALARWKSEPATPLVIADGQTFLELDHYLDDPTAARLVFLTGRDAALRFMATDCYDGAMRLARPWFPFRARIEPYDYFLSAHAEFLILGDGRDAHEWISDRLAADGWRLDVIGQAPGRRLTRASRALKEAPASTD